MTSASVNPFFGQTSAQHRLLRRHKLLRDKDQNASPCNTSQPFWFQFRPQKVSHFGVLQLPGKAHLVRRACLGSCPCLHEELELMVLKWRPDGDRGLIAAEGAPASRPPLLSSYSTSLYLLSSTCYHPSPAPVSSLLTSWIVFFSVDVTPDLLSIKLFPLFPRLAILCPSHTRRHARTRAHTHKDLPAAGCLRDGLENPLLNYCVGQNKLK